MPTTPQATPRAPKPMTLNHEAREAMARLAIEYGHRVVDTPAEQLAAEDYRHAVAILVVQLEQAGRTIDEVYKAGYDTGRKHAVAGPADAARRALADALARPRLCQGTAEFVPDDVVGPDGVATCSRCHAPRPTDEVEPGGRWRVMSAHVARGATP